MRSEARRLGALTETVHAVVYFAPEPAQRYGELGLRGYWRGYFASRSAALGRASPQLVTALFAGFAPAMVARALPDVWSGAGPEQVQQARLDGAVAALRRLLGDVDVRSVADLTGQVVDGLDLADRPLAAAHAALPRPAEPLAALWLDCTVLREHRGDAHLAAVSCAGLQWPEPHLLLAGLDRVDLRQQEHRGWSDEQWGRSRTALTARGLLDATGRTTDAGRDRYSHVEALTDTLAALAYDDADGHQLAGLLAPLTERIVSGDGVPFPNAMGLLRPT